MSQKELAEICTIAEGDLCQETGIDEERIARVAGLVIDLMLKNLSGPTEVFGCISLSARIMANIMKAQGFNKDEVIEIIQSGYEVAAGATPIVVIDDPKTKKS